MTKHLGSSTTTGVVMGSYGNGAAVLNDTDGVVSVYGNTLTGMSAGYGKNIAGRGAVAVNRGEINVNGFNPVFDADGNIISSASAGTALANRSNGMYAYAGSYAENATGGTINVTNAGFGMQA
ncbi:hypothetical protein QCK34_004554, partial [Enterobacter asburiae]|nr:hypothetical protein [Enterobacter asburiae]